MQIMGKGVDIKIQNFVFDSIFGSFLDKLRGWGGGAEDCSIDRYCHWRNSPVWGVPMDLAGSGGKSNTKLELNQL